MKVETFQYDIHQLQHLGTGEEQRLFEIWDSGRQMDHRLFNFASDVVIFGAPIDDTLPPELHVGEQSMAARFFGKDWRKSFKKEVATPQPITSAYESAYDGEPVHDYVVVEKGPIICTYDRLILPFKEGKHGAPMLVTLSTLVRLESATRLSAIPQIPGDPKALVSNPVLLGRDASPNLSHR